MVGTVALWVLLDKNVSFILLCSLHCKHLPIGFVQTSDDVAVTYLYREGCEIIPDV